MFEWEQSEGLLNAEKMPSFFRQEQKMGEVQLGCISAERLLVTKNMVLRRCEC